MPPCYEASSLDLLVVLIFPHVLWCGAILQMYLGVRCWLTKCASGMVLVCSYTSVMWVAAKF